MATVLVLDDDAELRKRAVSALTGDGHVCIECGNAPAAARVLDGRRFDLVLANAAVAGEAAFAVLRRIRDRGLPTPVVLFSTEPTPELAQKALRERADDFLLSGPEGRALADWSRRLGRGEAVVARGNDDLAIMGDSPAMRSLAEKLSALAASDAALLITGESGTGKELVAHSVHRRSRCAAGPFVAINCAAFPDTLIEEELFGHERGAFTGALRRREGRFRAAHGGTLFLDEIAELSAPAQAKLLRVLQDHTFEAIGSNVPQRVEVRVISATHRDLRALIAEGRFREDLYYRVKVVSLHLPPLRERRDDLFLYVDFFLRRLAPPGTAPARLSTAAQAALAAYPFPGNLRELEHALHHAVVLARGGTVDVGHLPGEISGGVVVGEEGATRPLRDAIDDFERDYLVRALRKAGGVKARAAEMLGISRKTLWQKLRQHGLMD